MAGFGPIVALATGIRPWVAASVAMRLLLMATYVGQALLMAGILAQPSRTFAFWVPLRSILKPAGWSTFAGVTRTF